MKSTVITILITVVCVAGLIAILKGHSSSTSTKFASTSVITDGKQIVEIQAKGGYTPRVTTAKAGIPTVIQVETSGTFDCSSSLTIPAIGYSQHLPASGTTTIEIPAQNANAVVQGICSMGMYSFSIKFV